MYSTFNTGQAMYSVTVSRVHVTVVAVEKQQLLRILSAVLALVIQHAIRMRRIVLSSMTYPAVQFFSYYLINGTDFEKKLT